MLPPLNPQTSNKCSAFLLCLLALGESMDVSHSGNLWLGEPERAVSGKALSDAQASAFSF